MRAAFINEMILQARLRPEIFLVVGDLGYSVVEPYAEEFPDRFLNAGVAEQNMTGVAAGLASEGYHVLTYSIANFPTTRCLEQIRNDVCYHQLPVTIVAVGGGLAYGSMGYSHHAIQDYAIMRSLPGMSIVSPGDPVETAACLKWICNSRSPSYLRLGKAGETTFVDDSWDVCANRILPLNQNQSGPPPDRIILSTGTMLATAVAAANALNEGGQNWGVATLPIWSDSGKAAVREQLGHYESIISVEDHLEAGGFGSFLREAIGNAHAMQARLRTFSLDPKVCGMVGSQAELNRIGGVSEQSIVSLALDA